MNMKRIVCMLLAAMLLITAVPLSARAETGGKLIAITFDDGPCAYTRTLLNALDEIGGHVTFFMLGRSASGNTDIVERAYLAGHQIGCHSWDHPELTSLSNDEVRSQFTRSYRVLDSACGAGTKYLTRAPYGSSSSRVRSVVNTPFIYWSVDTLDWQLLNSDKVYNAIMREAKDGAIVLLHDIHKTSVNGAIRALKDLKAKDYELVTVNELFRRRGVTMNNCTTYYSCGPNGTDYGALVDPVITYTPASNGYLKVTITSQPGTTIYYNLDGKPFKADSRVYTEPFYVQNNTTIWAISATNLNGDRSKVVSTVAKFLYCDMPQLTMTGNRVTMTNTVPGARIVYTTDGTTPTESSTQYTQPVAVAPGTVVSAMSCGDGMHSSGVNRLYYSSNGNMFRDVFPGVWYCNAMDWAVSRQMLTGMGDSYYYPNGNATRGQFVTMLYRLAGSPQVTPTHSFQDVKPNAYYASAVAWAYQNGLVNGYNATQFGPNDDITREAVAKMVYGYMTFCNAELPAANGQSSKYKDSDSIAPYAQVAMDVMTATGIIRGMTDGTVCPKKTSTRAEAVTMLQRMVDYME